MRLTKWFLDLFIGRNDPVYYCKVYKDMGCADVDGFLCDMKTCIILKEYKEMLEGTEEENV